MIRIVFGQTMQMSDSALIAFKGRSRKPTPVRWTPPENRRWGCDLTCAPGGLHHPATGYIEAGDQVLRVARARGRGSCDGTLTADRATRPRLRAGLSRSQRGNVSPANLFDQMVGAGRAERPARYTIIAADSHGKAAVGGTRIPLLFGR